MIPIVGQLLVRAWELRREILVTIGSYGSDIDRIFGMDAGIAETIDECNRRYLKYSITGELQAQDLKNWE